MRVLHRLIYLSLILLVAQASAFDIVDIPDPNLQKAIREKLKLPDEIPITQQEMLRLGHLRVESPDLKDLTGLEYATNLEDLSLGTVGMVSDLTPIANLSALRNLNVAGNQISDIRPLAELINLQGLILWSNEIQDITPLANLTNLTALNLTDNGVEDITPLTNLTALEILRLNRNKITDITPLANLNVLETLWLDRNRITDITPLIGLTNLKELRIAENPIHDFNPLLQLEGVELDVDINRLNELNTAVEVPDPNLESAVRETLSLPDEVPLTQLHMLRLTRLRVESPQLKNLTGLEHATNLENLSLGTVGMVSDLTPLSNLIALRNLNVGGNQISDIRPLATLLNLTEVILWKNQVRYIAPLANLTNLISLNLAKNSVEDITPLANLTNLTSLNLAENSVEDITPLANLTGLTKLTLSYNQVTDLNPLTGLIGLISLNLKNNRISNFSPLANLVNLEKLFINNNLGTDISLLRGLNLIEFVYDEICDIAPFTPSVTERIKSRRYPSIFSPGGLRGPEHRTQDDPATLYDLYAYKLWIGFKWLITEAVPTFGLSTQVGGNLEPAQEVRRRHQQLNPNFVYLMATISWFATGSIDRFPPDSEFWLRDENGEIVKLDIRGRWFEYQTDFFHPSFQDLLVERIVAIANCGLFDGILLDGFRNNATGFVGRHLRPQSNAEIIAAMTSILSRVRARVRDDFLILANTNRSKLTAYTEYINGTFMETTYDYATEYTRGGLAEIESTLLWSEENLRYPRINCLEGEGIGSEPSDSPANKQRMRLFTTMGLTHSDGYVVYTSGAGEYGGSDHEHIWHSFWDADLGRPVGSKAQPYENIDGLFIREFTNGWAVYNRSGNAQEVSLPESATGVSSGKSGITHQLSDLDGEIYLKAPNPTDVNGDGKVNVLDLVQVANGFGKSAPDPNGDGVVNILDLVFVAQQFSQ